MSIYQYTSGDDRLEIYPAAAHSNTCFVAISDLNAEASIYIPNADAPAIAAELLKAAGQESVIVAKAYSDVVEVTPGEYECGDGPERAYGSVSQNSNWLYNKAANYIALAEYIENKDQREAEAAKKLQERRDALARGFSGGISYGQQHHATRRAIDAYIELEDGK